MLSVSEMLKIILGFSLVLVALLGTLLSCSAWADSRYTKGMSSKSRRKRSSGRNLEESQRREILTYGFVSFFFGTIGSLIIVPGIAFVIFPFLVLMAHVYLLLVRHPRGDLKIKVDDKENRSHNSSIADN